MPFLIDWKKGPLPREGMTDAEVLRRALAHMKEDEELKGDDEAPERFAELIGEFDEGYRKALSPRQRAWANAVLDRYEPRVENLVSRGLVPRGRPVETPAALRPENLPKRPPARRKDPDE